jgi:hypothetical protein
MKDVDFEVWAFQVYSTVLPNIVVDITDVIDEKIRLIIGSLLKNQEIGGIMPKD